VATAHGLFEVAAAIAAHLLHLISTGDEQAEIEAEDQSADRAASAPNPALTGAASNRPSNPSNGPVFNPASNPSVQPRPIPARSTPPVQPASPAEPYNPTPGVNTDRPANGHQRPAERARTLAQTHRDHTGALPTVTELSRLADVARGTAATALKALREQRAPLHLVNQPPPKGTHQ